MRLVIWSKSNQNWINQMANFIYLFTCGVQKFSKSENFETEIRKWIFSKTRNNLEIYNLYPKSEKQPIKIAEKICEFQQPIRSLEKKSDTKRPKGKQFGSPRMSDDRGKPWDVAIVSEKPKWYCITLFCIKVSKIKILF